MRLILSLLTFLYCGICTSQELTLKVLKGNFGIDETNALIVSHIDSIENYSNTNGYEEITIILDEKKYTFRETPNNLNYSTSYLITNSLNEYKLYFTQLPLISIESKDTIVDEPKASSRLTYSDEKQIISSNIGIELRGGFSQFYPKKTYDLEFWEDEGGLENKDVKLGELRSDDDWVLDALYNEPLRIRSYIASKLWLEMHRPYYLSEESEAKSGADLMYVELFINGKYNGIYTLSEQVDKKLLKIKSYNGNIRGELYKGDNWGEAVLFSGLPDYDNEEREWGGYEYKYPKDDEITDWKNIYTFTDFVVYSSDFEFNNDIWRRFSFDNYSDYFLFLNLIRARDNTGKNIYLARHNLNEPYFYVPWDLDGCFGTNWEGKNENVSDDLLSNGFIDRVLDLNPSDTINSHIAMKWFDYRKTIFEMDYLSDNISERYEYFMSNKLYERESIVYPNYLFDEEDLSYALSWMAQRIEYMDIYFSSFLSIEKESRSITPALAYPNPTENQIFINPEYVKIGEQYKIYNTLGQIVHDGINNGSAVSLEKIEKGIYFITTRQFNQKLIKK